MQDTWTIKAALDWTQGYLERKGDENPRLSAQWLLCAATGLARIDLYTHFDQPLSPEERETLRGQVTRRATGEPLQYITGEVGFRYITLKVEPGVLIPRPETEVLVGLGLAALGACDQATDAYLVADLCTGTGCVACSIAHENPASHVIATDISPDAVQLARKNSEALGLDARIEVIECDLGAGIDAQLMGTFDLVISNPPYVPSSVVKTIPDEVKNFEPALALDGGPDGLDLFRRLLPFAHGALKPGGTLAVELHEEGMEHAASLAEKAGFTAVDIVHDLADKPRVLVATRKEA
ncbi:MAG: peptide chain release factor N(5)-glutamine methyltransferase [Raoultibacter sp.]